MPRLIDAEVAEKNWWQELRTNYADDYGKGFQAGLLAVIRQPTIDLAPQWIPVTERLPEEWVDVLALLKSGGCVVAVISGRYWRERWNNELMDRPPTHWMPLPKPPEDGGADHAAAE